MEIIGFIICILLLASPFIAFEIYKRKIKIFNKGVMSFKESLDLTNLPIVTFTSGDKKYNFLLTYCFHLMLSSSKTYGLHF